MPRHAERDDDQEERPRTPRRSYADENRLLKNKLSVKDARHILATEGKITPRQIGFQLLSALFIAALLARAIYVGNATVWHLVMPMVAQYLALLAGIPIAYAIVQHPAMKKEALQSVRLWIGLLAALAISTLIRSTMFNHTWVEQLAADDAAFWRWITDAQMQWPIFAAFVLSLISLPSKVRNLYEVGPPFVAVSLGCGMRFAVLFLTAMLIPFAVSNANQMAWFLWTIMLLSEFLTLWMHWDVQQSLKRYDAGQELTTAAPPGQTGM